MKLTPKDMSGNTAFRGTCDYCRRHCHCLVYVVDDFGQDAGDACSHCIQEGPPSISGCIMAFWVVFILGILVSIL